MVVSWILFQYFVYTLAYTTIGYALMSGTTITDNVLLAFIFYPILKQVKLHWITYLSFILAFSYVFIDYVNQTTSYDSHPHHTRMVTLSFTIISCLVYFYIFAVKERYLYLISNPMLIFCSVYLIYSAGIYLQDLFWLDIMQNNIDFNIQLYLILFLNLGILLTFVSAIFFKPKNPVKKSPLPF